MSNADVQVDAARISSTSSDNDFDVTDIKQAALEDDTSSSGSSSPEEESKNSDQSSSEAEDESAGDDSQIQEDPILPSARVNSTSPMSDASPSLNLSSRLADFLPSIKAANAKLGLDQAEGKSSNLNIELDEDQSEEPHVDMNLGLGVFEQVEVGSDDEEEDLDGTVNDSEVDSTSQAPGLSMNPKESADASKRKTGPLDVLMGRKKRRKPEIEDLGHSES